MTVFARAKAASKVQFIAVFASKGIGFLLTILLARILNPEDYGYFSIAILVTGFLSIFSNFGFQSFLIQKQTLNRKTVHTTFFLEFSFSFLIALMLFLSSFAFQTYYDVTIGAMLRLYALNITLSCLTNVPLALYKKEFDFRSSSKAEVANSISSNCFRVIFAGFGFGALSFPLGDLVGTATKTAVVFCTSSFRPKLAEFSRAHAGEILNFGSYTSVTSIASYFANQTDKILISSFFPVKLIGLYNFGYSQSSLFYNLILVSQSSVFQSLFAKVKDNLTEARDAVYKITRFINFLALPVYVFIIMETDLVITILFTEKWLPASFYFKVFAFDFLVRTFISSITGIQIAFGLVRQAARTKIITSSVFVAVLLAATYFRELKYYAVAYFVATVLTASINLLINGKVIRLDFKRFIFNLVPNFFAIILSISLYSVLKKTDIFSFDLTGLMFSATTFLLIYLMISVRFNAPPLFQAVRLFSGFKRG